MLITDIVSPGSDTRRAIFRPGGQDGVTLVTTTPGSAVGPAAPLLAHTARKVGALDKAPRADKPQAGASYQPKTEPPETPVHAQPVAPQPAIDFMAMAQPWMTLGWRMTAAGLALQARMAKAALGMPPATTAMRQGAEALNAWLRLVQTRPPKARKD